MAKLTKRVIDSIRHPPSGQTFERDDALPGFALRVTPGVPGDMHGGTSAWRRAARLEGLR